MSAVCEALAANASGGVAPALRAVDCLANEMAAGAFARLFGSEGALLPALTILLTLYIAIFAFALITGRSRLGISVLTPRMMTLGLVLTFATSWLAWQQVVWNLAIGAPDQIASLLMGMKGSAAIQFADRIDMVVAAIADAAGPGDAQGAAQNAANSGTFSPSGAMWLGAMLLLLGTVGVLVTSRIALAVLLATGPVFVIMALFAPTRGLTAGWLRGLVMTAITPLFVTLGGSLMLELAVPVVAALRSDAGAIDARAAMALFLIASVHCALMAMMLKVAGSMMAAWNVFGLVSPREEASRAAAAPAAPASVGLAEAQMAAAPAAAMARPALLARNAAPAEAALPGAPAPAGTPAASSRGRVTIHQAAPAAASLPVLPRTRARGIGSRFAAPQAARARETMR